MIYSFKKNNVSMFHVKHYFFLDNLSTKIKKKCEKDSKSENDSI